MVLQPAGWSKTLSKEKPNKGKDDLPDIPALTNEPNGEQIRSYVRIMVQEDERFDKARKRRNTVRKQMKAAGVELGILDEMIADMNRPMDEVNKKRIRQQKYAVALQLPFLNQGDLFEKIKQESDETGESASQGDVAFSKGFQAGVMGKEPKVPEEWLPFNQQWIKGHEAGQKSLAHDLLLAPRATAADDEEFEEDVKSEANINTEEE